MSVQINIDLNKLTPILTHSYEIYTLTCYHYGEYFLVTETTEEDNCIKFYVEEIPNTHCRIENLKEWKAYHGYMFLGACYLNRSNKYTFNLGDDDSKIRTFKHISVENHKPEYIETAKNIVQAQGKCLNESCSLCPFDKTNIKGGCLDRFRRESVVQDVIHVNMEDSELAKWAQVYIDEFSKEDD